uniref:Uncharacterized protein n=1 Tax=Siphoviridae sp. ctxc31 TaxID=2826520 RepID=A0A8S5MM99_9CAUD|nr:MAG TPA: hypothetical protein [Siphoviridae sp. ctxc31]
MLFVMKEVDIFMRLKKFALTLLLVIVCFHFSNFESLETT